MDSASESATDRDSSRSLNPVPLTRSTTTIMPTPNIVYLNDWFGSGRSFVSDMTSDDHRYSILPRSETGRRLYHKRHRRQQRRAEDTTTTLSENVSEYKGNLPVDKLLAFINSDKIGTSTNTSENSPNKSAAGSGTKKVRRRKKQAGDRSEDSDAASISTMDTSSLCSGYEVAESIDSIADAEIEIHQPGSAAVVIDEYTTGLYDGRRNMDSDPAAASDQDHFVIVQKKKKGRQPVPQTLPPRRHETSRRLPYSSFTSTQAARSRPAPPETYKMDDTVSLTSDTDSTWSYSRDGGSKAASVRCSSPDFPDLALQAGTIPGRRNSTGNVCETEKVSLPPSTISYAIVAAGGMRPSTVTDIEWRRSSDVFADAVSHSVAELPRASDRSAEPEYFCNNNNLPSVGDMHAESKLLSENFHRTDTNSSERSTPTGYCSADSHSLVSDDLAKELSDIKLQKATKRNLQTDSHTAVAFSKCDRKLMLGGCCDRRTGPPTSPVVFLDIASERHRSVRNSSLGGVSFGFDSSDSVGNNIVVGGHSECSSSESGFSDCTMQTDTTDKISSTDSATSPIDPQDFVPDRIPTGVVQQTVTIGHCRPIVPFITGGTCSHTPVGIVPPIPQVERTSEALDQDTAKDSKAEDILSSVISITQKHEILHRELMSAAADKRFPPHHEKSSVLSAADSAVVSSVVTSVCSAVCTSGSPPVGGFNLHTAQLFLYTGQP